MKLREDQERLQGLLKETLTLLCKNGLQFDKGFCIDALIGITTDDKDVFLVNIKETVKNPGAVFSDEEEAAKLEQSDSSEDEDERPRSARKRPPDDRGGDGISPVKRSRSNHHDDDDDASNLSSINASEHDSAMNIKAEPHDDDELVFVKQELSDNDQQHLNMQPYPIGSFTSGAQHNLNQSLPANFHSGGFTNNMNSPNTSMDGSQMGTAMNESWSQPPSGNLDPSQLANVSMTSQSTSQGGSQQMVCPFCCKVYKWKQKYDFHLRGVHKVGEPVECKKCGRNDFKAYSTYFKHSKNCHGTVSREPQLKGVSPSHTSTNFVIQYE